MTNEITFEAVFVLNGSRERIETAFYGVDYADARAKADRAIADSDGEIEEIVFECEL